MSEQTAQAEPISPTDEPVSGRWINDEFLRRFREGFDQAERAKRENNRRLEARLAELRAQRSAL